MMTAVATRADEETDVERADANLQMLLVLLHSEVASGPGDVVGHQRGKEDLNKNVTNLLTQLSVAIPTSHLHIMLKLPQ